MEHQAFASDPLRQTLFVHGVQKTGTSTLVGILNCHPEIFVLYETRLDRALVTNYGNQLLERFPEARRFFRNATDISQPYVQFFDWLEQRCPEYRYRFTGDKLIDFDSQLTQQHRSECVIFAMRDIRSWLCKEQIVKYYRTDLDVVPAAIEFLRYIIGTFKCSNCLRIWLEDLIQQNELVIAGLSGFLGLDLAAHTERWWEQISSRHEEDPKTSLRWFKGHPSSNLAPEKLDTSYKLKANLFWDTVVPLIEKYREASTSGFDCHDIDRDLASLERLRSLSPLPLADCYETIETTRLGFSSPVPSANARQDYDLKSRGIKKFASKVSKFLNRHGER